MNYSVIGVVPAINTAGAASYVFNEDIALGGGAYYRIKVINKDNSRAYTRSISLKNEGKTNSSGIALLQNPLKSTLAFQYDAIVTEDAMVNLYNITGVKVQTFMTKMQKGTNVIIHPLDSRIGSGTFILEVASPTQRKVVKLIK